MTAGATAARINSVVKLFLKQLSIFTSIQHNLL